MWFLFWDSLFKSTPSRKDNGSIQVQTMNLFPEINVSLPRMQRSALRHELPGSPHQGWPTHRQ